MKKESGQVVVKVPQDGNTAPPGPYLLFVIDTNGVPSEGAFISVGTSGANSAPNGQPQSRVPTINKE